MATKWLKKAKIVNCRFFLKNELNVRIKFIMRINSEKFRIKFENKHNKKRA